MRTHDVDGRRHRFSPFACVLVSLVGACSHPPQDSDDTSRSPVPPFSDEVELCRFIEAASGPCDAGDDCVRVVCLEAQLLSTSGQWGSCQVARSYPTVRATEQAIETARQACVGAYVFWERAWECDHLTKHRPDVMVACWMP